MIRAIVVDDEPLARDCVRVALDAQDDVELVAECGNGESAVQAIREHEPDLVFLDVQMPGMDGFEVIARIGADAMPPVIFVTAYDRHALRAFEVHALDYLLKPFDDDRFGEVLERARAHLAVARDSELGRRLSALLTDRLGKSALDDRPRAAEGRYLARFTTRDGERIRFVAVRDVDWIEAHGNYVRLHSGESTSLVRATLSSIADRLDPRTFVRIHRSTIVNIDRIREVQPWFGGDYIAIMRDGRQLRVSRSRASALLSSTG